MFKASSPDSNSSAMPLWIYSFPLIPVLIPVLIWAINMVVTKYAASVIEPVSISFWRMLIALIVMLPFVYSALYRQCILKYDITFGSWLCWVHWLCWSINVCLIGLDTVRPQPI